MSQPADPLEAPDGFKLVAERRNVSPMHYLGGSVFTAGAPELEGDDKRILRANMSGNGYAKVIRTISGNWVPFEADAVLLAAVSR